MYEVFITYTKTKLNDSKGNIPTLIETFILQYYFFVVNKTTAQPNLKSCKM